MKLLAIAALFVFTAIGGVLGLHTSEQIEMNTVEIGLAETSPHGEMGGYAVPASGCSSGHVHAGENCVVTTPVDIKVDKTIIRAGDPVLVSWDPGGRTDCTLSIQLTGDPNVIASETVYPTGETTYTITCSDGASDAETVQVLPVIEET